MILTLSSIGAGIVAFTLSTFAETTISIDVAIIIGGFVSVVIAFIGVISRQNKTHQEVVNAINTMDTNDEKRAYRMEKLVIKVVTAGAVTASKQDEIISNQLETMHRLEVANKQREHVNGRVADSFAKMSELITTLTQKSVDEIKNVVTEQHVDKQIVHQSTVENEIVKHEIVGEKK